MATFTDPDAAAATTPEPAMNSRQIPLSTATASIVFAGMSLRDLAPQLTDMLADEDWSPACQDDARLRELLARMQDDPVAAAAPPPPDIAMLAFAYADFRRFCREQADRLNEPDGCAMHATPDEWLRLRQYASARDGRTFADYRLEGDRFHVS